MLIKTLNTTGLNDLSPELIMENGKLKLLHANDYYEMHWDEVRAFCHFQGRYGLPTVEVVEYLKDIIDGRTAIEIGSGHGDLGFHLGIPMTDSKIQSKPDIQKEYEKMKQPIIKYPEDVEELEARAAVKKYKPKVVVASWVTNKFKAKSDVKGFTYGVDEEQIINAVETYILVGNLEVHGHKAIMNRRHIQIAQPWIISRSIAPQMNRIFIWNNEKRINERE